MGNKKILIYDPISRTGGGLAYITNILLYLKNNNELEFVLYCNRSIKNEIENIKQDIKIIYSPEGSEKGGLKAFLQRSKISKEEILKINPDLILYMNQIPIYLDIPSILFLRNALYFLSPGKNYLGPISFKDKLRTSILRNVTTKSIKKSNLLLTSSESFANDIRNWYTKSFEIKVIPFGTNSITESKDNSKNEKIKNLLILQYNFYKGVEIAVKAFEELCKENEKINLTITDNLKDHHDKRARKLWDYIQNSNCSDKIICTGKLSQEKLKDLYAKSDIFLFPSYVESFGHGILEAMNNGIPTVLSDIPVFKEIAGDAALFFKVGDYKDLADKIMNYIENEKLRDEKISKGYDVVKQYTWKNHVEKLTETALDLVKENK